MQPPPQQMLPGRHQHPAMHPGWSPTPGSPPPAAYQPGVPRQGPGGSVIYPPGMVMPNPPTADTPTPPPGPPSGNVPHGYNWVYGYNLDQRSWMWLLAPEP